MKNKLATGPEIAVSARIILRAPRRQPVDLQHIENTTLANMVASEIIVPPAPPEDLTF